jgi:catechol-2,3-dioxygenase
MLNILKLGHTEFEVQDVERMAEFYSNVIGLTETGRDRQAVYLSTSIDHHSIVLRGGARKTRLSKLAFQVAPIANGDLTKHFKDGLDAEVRTGSQPAINQVVRTQKPRRTTPS